MTVPGLLQVTHGEVGTLLPESNLPPPLPQMKAAFPKNRFRAPGGLVVQSLAPQGVYKVRKSFQFSSLRDQPRGSDRESDDMQTESAKKDVDFHMKELYVKRVYTLYTNQDKVRFFKLSFEKRLSASATAQRWANSMRIIQTASLRSVRRKVNSASSARSTRRSFRSTVD